jgi:hypothetical protein
LWHELGLPAEVLDLDAVLERGLDHGLPGRDLDLLAVNGALRHAYLFNAEIAEVR